ncbi:MAG TPA: radical SAM family heme chaperone HemW [Gemmatimonadales bacterium]|nr:radical SAM family heme chaperone HemW [Gemmatimonadales bacterium]
MHVYFHVPFCARRCSYCDFAIAVRRAVPAARYVDLVLREWGERQEHPGWNESPRVRTIYFGGGTPSLLPPDAVAALLQRIRSDRALAPDAEITLEANPDDVTPMAAGGWRSAGVTRLSVGAQSFQPAVLRWMHRTHDASAIAAAVRTARAAGFDDVSLDLIFGLPAELQRDWPADLDCALALAPEHLSLYGLTTEPRTPLARWTDRGLVNAAPEDRYADEYLTAHGALAAAGFEHYEVSNAARAGRRAQHNSAYWRRAPYLGLGPSAHSSVGPERWWNLREWAAYARAVENGGSAVAGRERLDSAAIRLEELYLGLRTLEGVPADRIPTAHAARWTRDGWARVGEGRVVLTPDGWLRLDALVAAV